MYPAHTRNHVPTLCEPPALSGRREGIALLDGGHDLVGDDDGLGELLAAVDHAVTDRVDLLHGADDAVLLVHEGVQNSRDGFVVGGHGDVGGLDGLLALELGLVGELAVDADALAKALGEQRAGGIERGVQRINDDENRQQLEREGDEVVAVDLLPQEKIGKHGDEDGIAGENDGDDGRLGVGHRHLAICHIS